MSVTIDSAWQRVEAWVQANVPQEFSSLIGPGLSDEQIAEVESQLGFGLPEQLKARLETLYPGIDVVGMYSPPFRELTPEEDEAVVRRINDSGADYVWIGLGSPKQDRWVADHRDRLNAAAVLAVGAAFDYNAGLLRKAPTWMQRSGLQWFFRLATEPRRLWKRYTVSNARFLWLLATDTLKNVVRR